jgi:hypothetical protein
MVLQRQPAPREVPARDRNREVKWIADNRSVYAGQWVAVEGDRLVAADMDARKVSSPQRPRVSRSRLWHTFFLKIRFRLFRVGRMPARWNSPFRITTSSSAEGIAVPVTPGSGGQSVDRVAKLDTGVAHCIFERRYAAMLGINPESGRLPDSDWLLFSLRA